jgi:hypothetical protein
MCRSHHRRAVPLRIASSVAFVSASAQSRIGAPVQRYRSSRRLRGHNPPSARLRARWSSAGHVQIDRLLVVAVTSIARENRPESHFLGAYISNRPELPRSSRIPTQNLPVRVGCIYTNGVPQWVESLHLDDDEPINTISNV